MKSRYSGEARSGEFLSVGGAPSILTKCLLLHGASSLPPFLDGYNWLS